MAAQDIINAYQARLRRGPDARELESELENDAKYGHDQLLRNLDERAAPTFSGGGRGGDADTNNDGQADEGWIGATPGRGRSWVRAGEPGAPMAMPGGPSGMPMGMGMASSGMSAMQGNPYLMPHGVRRRPRTLGDVTGLSLRGGR